MIQTTMDLFVAPKMPEVPKSVSVNGEPADFAKMLESIMMKAAEMAPDPMMLAPEKTLIIDGLFVPFGEEIMEEINQMLAEETDEEGDEDITQMMNVQTMPVAVMMPVQPPQIIEAETPEIDVDLPAKPEAKNVIINHKPTENNFNFIPEDVVPEDEDFVPEDFIPEEKQEKNPVQYTEQKSEQKMNAVHIHEPAQKAEQIVNAPEIAQTVQKPEVEAETEPEQKVEKEKNISHNIPVEEQPKETQTKEAQQPKEQPKSDATVRDAAPIIKEETKQDSGGEPKENKENFEMTKKPERAEKSEKGETQPTERRAAFSEFLNNITEQKSAPLSAPRPATPPQMNLFNTGRAAFTESIENVIRFVRSEGTNRATLIIDPPAIGRVSVEIIATANGIETSLKVSNEQVRALVQDQIVQLKQALQQIGVNVAEFSVDVQQQDKEREQFAGQQQKNKAHLTDKDMEDETTDEEVFKVDLRKGLLHWIG